MLTDGKYLHDSNLPQRRGREEGVGELGISLSLPAAGIADRTIATGLTDHRPAVHIGIGAIGQNRNAVQSQD